MKGDILGFLKNIILIFIFYSPLVFLWNYKREKKRGGKDPKGYAMKFLKRDSIVFIVLIFFFLLVIFL